MDKKVLTITFFRVVEEGGSAELMLVALPGESLADAVREAGLTRVTELNSEPFQISDTVGNRALLKLARSKRARINQVATFIRSI